MNTSSNNSSKLLEWFLIIDTIAFFSLYIIYSVLQLDTNYYENNTWKNTTLRNNLIIGMAITSVPLMPMLLSIRY